MRCAVPLALSFLWAMARDHRRVENWNRLVDQEQPRAFGSGALILPSAGVPNRHRDREASALPMRDAQAELAVALAEAECGRWQNFASRRSPVADRTRHRSPIADRKGVVSTQLNTLNTRILISAQHGTTSASIIQSLLPALSVLCLRIKVEAASCHFVQKRLESRFHQARSQSRRSL